LITVAFVSQALYEQRCTRISKVTLLWLKARAAEMGISEADLIRRILDEYRLECQANEKRAADEGKR
jgi:hypothetical protein